MTFEAFPLFPGVPGGMELAVILLIAILLFGANKIPKLARSTGEAMGEFKKGREAVEQELEEMRGAATMDESELEGSTSTEGPTPEPTEQSNREPASEAATDGEPDDTATDTARDTETETDER